MRKTNPTGLRNAKHQGWSLDERFKDWTLHKEITILGCGSIKHLSFAGSVCILYFSKLSFRT